MALQNVDFAASSALVTGGSSGIGRAIAEELIARGVRRLILVAKTGDKLDKAAEEMRASTPDLTLRTIQADLLRETLPRVSRSKCKDGAGTLTFWSTMLGLVANMSLRKTLKLTLLWQPLTLWSGRWLSS